MKNTFTIRTFIFGIVFIGVMSVSFLVEASDAPKGATATASEPDEMYGPPAPASYEFPYDEVKNGVASWYGSQFHGRKTASGRRFDMNELTAAHKTLPFGTLLRVENEETGEAVVVEVTDRGPFVHKRVVDLSRAAAQLIGVGVAPVQLDGVTPESLADFYNGNDTMVVTITPDMDIMIRDIKTISNERRVGSYTKAMRLADHDEVVVVRLDDEGQTQYFVASTSASDVAAR